MLNLYHQYCITQFFRFVSGYLFQDRLIFVAETGPAVPPGTLLFILCERNASCGRRKALWRFGSDAEAGNSWVKSEFLFSGVLRRVIDERECFATLRTTRSASAAKSSSCQCAGRQPSAADTEDSLLVVQSLTSLEALRAALQPVCGSSSTGASETVVSTLSHVSLSSKQVARQQWRDSLLRSRL